MLILGTHNSLYAATPKMFVGATKLKLIRFKVDKKECYGVLRDNQIISLTTLSSFRKSAIPKTIDDLVSLGTKILGTIENYVKDLNEDYQKTATVRVEKVEVLAPMANPPKLICLGLNYYDHAAEQDAKIPDEPIIFMKPRTSIIGPNKPIVKPDFVNKLDYEAELAIVIGKRGKNIPAKEAKQYILGYSILNDVSARDIQFKDRQWTRGKSFDTFAPMGPNITTANQIGDPNNLKIRTWINGDLRQDSSTKNMVFDVYEIVHHLSKVMTLEPGDIIATGTPAGVGFFMKPEPKFLRPDDTINMEIEGIGKLENYVAEGS